MIGRVVRKKQKCHMSLSVAVAVFGLMMWAGPMDGTQAAERGRAYVTRHHAGAHAARTTCYHWGLFSPDSAGCIVGACRNAALPIRVGDVVLS